MKLDIEMTREEFFKSVIAQDDDSDYQESGYVAFQINDTFYLASYGHCSCYSTFTALCGGGVSDRYASGKVDIDWSGTKEELIYLAQNDLDPTWPVDIRTGRKNTDEDSQVDHLRAVYAQILYLYGDELEASASSKLQKLCFSVTVDDKKFEVREYYDEKNPNLTGPDTNYPKVYVFREGATLSCAVVFTGGLVGPADRVRREQTRECWDKPEWWELKHYENVVKTIRELGY